MGGNPEAFESFPSRAGDDLRAFKFPFFGKLGFLAWELVFASVPAATGALAPTSASVAERVAIASGLAVVGVVAGLGLLYILLLPVAIWRQRQEARETLRVVSETPFAFVERGAPLHVPALGGGLVYAPLSIRYQGPERATVERVTASVGLGFRGDGTNWHTNPHAAVASFPPYASPGDPSERSWRVKENGHWELLGLPVVVRVGGDLVLPNIGVEIVDESKVGDEYKRSEGAFLFLEVYIHSDIETAKISHTMPVIFCDETGADLAGSEPGS